MKKRKASNKPQPRRVEGNETQQILGIGLNLLAFALLHPNRHCEWSEAIQELAVDQAEYLLSDQANYL